VLLQRAGRPIVRRVESTLKDFIPLSFRRHVREVATRLQRRRSMIALLRAHRTDLRRGRYVIAGDVAHRSSYVPPAHILTRKAGPPSHVPVLLLSRIREPAVYEGLIRSNGGVLLFGGASRTVKRISTEASFDARYVELRQAISGHVRAPAFQVAPSGLWQIEQEVRGTCPVRLEYARQLDIVKKLLRGLTSLCSEECQGDSDQFVYEGLRSLRSSLLPSSLVPWITAIRDSRFLSQAPLVPGHGDLKLANVLADDHACWIIDWDPRYVALRPFWYDAIRLFHEAPHMQNAFWSGHLDHEFTQLFRAAGMTTDIGEVRRLLPAAMSTLFRSPNFEMESTRRHEYVIARYRDWAASKSSSL
jgi:hypothetical protein